MHVSYASPLYVSGVARKTRAWLGSSYEHKDHFHEALANCSPRQTAASENKCICWIQEATHQTISAMVDSTTNGILWRYTRLQPHAEENRLSSPPTHLIESPGMTLQHTLTGTLLRFSFFLLLPSSSLPLLLLRSAFSFSFSCLSSIAFLFSMPVRTFPQDLPFFVGILHGGSRNRFTEVDLLETKSSSSDSRLFRNFPTFYLLKL